MPALVQIMAWRRPGDKPLSEPMLDSLPTHICVTRPQWVNGKCYIIGGRACICRALTRCDVLSPLLFVINIDIYIYIYICVCVIIQFSMVFFHLTTIYSNNWLSDICTLYLSVRFRIRTYIHACMHRMYKFLSTYIHINIHIYWINFDALAQGNAYKPTKEPINYRELSGNIIMSTPGATSYNKFGTMETLGFQCIYIYVRAWVNFAVLISRNQIVSSHFVSQSLVNRGPNCFLFWSHSSEALGLSFTIPSLWSSWAAGQNTTHLHATTRLPL